MADMSVPTANAEQKLLSIREALHGAECAVRVVALGMESVGGECCEDLQHVIRCHVTDVLTEQIEALEAYSREVAHG